VLHDLDLSLSPSWPLLKLVLGEFPANLPCDFSISPSEFVFAGEGVIFILRLRLVTATLRATREQARKRVGNEIQTTNAFIASVVSVILRFFDDYPDHPIQPLHRYFRVGLAGESKAV
jgi:hypothetical protein